jgi:hypothetical protein
MIRTMTQILVAALFVLSLSILTFAASFAEVPRSEWVPGVASPQD